MNKNKGVIGIGLVLAVVLGIVVVGGGAYYLGNSNSKKEIVNPVVNVEENLLDEDKNGLPDFATLPHEYGDKSEEKNEKNTNSYIKIISPNGGEVFKAGENINVKWQSSWTSGFVDISIKNISNGVEHSVKGSISGAPNNGSSEFYTFGVEPGEYKIKICDTKAKSAYLEVVYEPNCESALDYSDNTFTINSEIETSVISKNGITVAIPKNGFTYNTDVARAAGNGAFALNVGYNKKAVVSIYKWSNQVLFEEVTPVMNDYSEHVLFDTNFKIDNLTAIYYKAKDPQIGGEDIIVVPSKLTTIQVSNASWIGITQSMLDQIISSIKFN